MRIVLSLHKVVDLLRIQVQEEKQLARQEPLGFSASTAFAALSNVANGLRKCLNNDLRIAIRAEFNVGVLFKLAQTVAALAYLVLRGDLVVALGGSGKKRLLGADFDALRRV